VFDYFWAVCIVKPKTVVEHRTAGRVYRPRHFVYSDVRLMSKYFIEFSSFLFLFAFFIATDLVVLLIKFEIDGVFRVV